MTKTIKFAGHVFELYSSGVLFLKEYKVMIVSDLHLHADTRFDNVGFVWPHNGRDILDRLIRCAEELKPEKLILLGDVFHAPESFSRMPLDVIDKIYRFLKSYEVVWVEGSHKGEFSPPNIDMRIEYAYLNLNFRHIAGDNEDFEISGYYHPTVFIQRRHENIRRRCFVCDKTKLLMPSFGRIEGGLDIKDPAIQSLFRTAPKIYPLGPTKVYRLMPERIAS